MFLLRRNFLSLIFASLFSPLLNACKKNASVKMLAFTDIHYDDARTDDGVKDYRKSFGKVQDAIAKTKGQKFDCVLNLGDIVEGKIGQLEKLLVEFATVDAPIKNVLGNHDLRCNPNAQRKMINRLFDNGKSFYHFDIKGWRFFVLDSLSISRVSKIKDERCTQETAYWLKKVKGKENGVVWGGGIDSEQLKWLENGLIEATKENKKVAVFCHMIIFPFSHATIFNHEQVSEILENNKCVKAFICGHLHEGGYVKHNNIHYLTLKSIIGNPETTFSTLEFTDDEIIVNGYGAERSRILKI